MNFRIGNTQIEGDGKSLSWTSGMVVDGDGAPTCYAPAHSGLASYDYLGNAGQPGNWYGIACDADGVPFIQGSEDPAPGYYVSTTALQDHSKPAQDPTRYVDSGAVPYISIPPELKHVGAKLGDLCVVRYRDKVSGAIIADIGPHGRVGEGSIALARNLGIPASPKNGGADSGVLFMILLGTASDPPWPRSPDEIAAAVTLT